MTSGVNNLLISSIVKSLSCKVGPKIQLGAWRSAVSFPSGMWGGAPADKRFGAF